MNSHRPAPKVWVLNLDAEQELGVHGSYTPSIAMRKIVAAQMLPLLGTLVAPGDYVLLDQSDSRAGALAPMRLDPQLDASGAVGRRADQTLDTASAQSLAKHLLPISDSKVLVGLHGQAWSPTRSALAKLVQFGAKVDEHPSDQALRTVNARGFAASLRAGLELEPGALQKHVTGSFDEVLAVLHGPAVLGWLVRRAFGAAGRGRMRIESLAGRHLAQEEASWIRASLVIGAVVIEPWVEVTEEMTRSAWLAKDGSLSISAPCLQGTTSTGAWSGSRRVAGAEINRSDDQALQQTLEAAGASLHHAGYHGPFGIDAFRHRTRAGKTALNPLSEINARFTMDWTCAMGKLPATESTTPCP